MNCRSKNYITVVKRRARQGFTEGRYALSFCLGVTLCQCSTRQNKLYVFLAECLLEAAHQKGNIDPLCPTICVRFIEYYISKILMTKQVRIARPKQQVLKHREIGEKDLRRV